MLDLKISAGYINEIPVRVIAADVAGPVHHFRIILLQRIRHKGLCRPLRIFVISKGQAGAGHANLAFGSVRRALLFRHFMVVLIQKKDLLVRECASGGNDIRQRVFLVSVQHIISAVAGNFGRAVEIHIDGVRKILLPLIELPDRHDFSAEHYKAHRLRRFIVQRVHDGDKTHRTDRPDQNTCLLFAEIIHQCCRRAEIFSRNNLHFRAGHQSAVNILDRYVKIKRCLIRKHVALADTEDLRQPGYKIENAPVSDRHTLGCSGRSAREVHIQRIKVRRLRPDH